MIRMKIDKKTGWCTCAKCGHKLFKIKTDNNFNLPIIEIKCKSCKSVNTTDYVLNLKEFFKLKQMLSSHGIPFKEESFGAPEYGCFTKKLTYYDENTGDSISDVIISRFSYGGKQGLLEQYGLVDKNNKDEVRGYLTADEVFKCWAQDYGYFVS